MTTSSKVTLLAVILAASAAVAYQNTIVNRQSAEIAKMQSRLTQAEAAERRATRETADISRQLLAAMQQQMSPAVVSLAVGAASSPLGAVGSNQPDPATVSAAGVEFRAPPLSQAVLTALPTPEYFAESYFAADGMTGTWPDLMKAGVGLREKSASVEEFMSTHAVLAGLVDSLRDTSVLLQKDTGSNPDVTRTLQENYATTTNKMVALANAIAERPNERPDAIEVSKQIAGLGKVIQGRLPPELQ